MRFVDGILIFGTLVMVLLLLGLISVVGDLYFTLAVGFFALVVLLLVGKVINSIK